MDTHQITTLIEQTSFRAAEQAWKDLLASIGTPSEDHIYIYRDVAMAWLGFAELRRARAVLEQAGHLADHPVLISLKEEVLQFEEAEFLGVSVRPFWLRGVERWKPQLMPPVNAVGHARRRWHAGRVENVGDKGIVEMTLVTTEVPLEDCRVLRKRLSARAWQAYSGWPAHPDQFFEVGEYEDETIIRIFPFLYCATH